MVMIKLEQKDAVRIVKKDFMFLRLVNFVLNVLEKNQKQYKISLTLFDEVWKERIK